MDFDSGLNIEPIASPLGFWYGPGCFGPAVENRSLDSIRGSLLDPQCTGPDPVYAIAMDVGRIEDRPHLIKRNLTVRRRRLRSGPARARTRAIARPRPQTVTAERMVDSRGLRDLAGPCSRTHAGIRRRRPGALLCRGGWDWRGRDRTAGLGPRHD